LISACAHEENDENDFSNLFSDSGDVLFFLFFNNAKCLSVFLIIDHYFGEKLLVPVATSLTDIFIFGMFINIFSLEIRTIHVPTMGILIKITFSKPESNL
jgi:hypothetical protein